MKKWKKKEISSLNTLPVFGVLVITFGGAVFICRDAKAAFQIYASLTSLCIYGPSSADSDVLPATTFLP